MVFAYGSSSGVNTAQGLPTDDPCASISEQTLTDLDAEPSSWTTGEYTNGCRWEVSIAGEDGVPLAFDRAVAFAEADADRLEDVAGDEEEVPRDTDELYDYTVEGADRVYIDLQEEGYSDSRDRSLSYGDESTLILHDVNYGYTDDRVNQSVTLVVREGDLVSRISFDLSGDTPAIDIDEAESLITRVADDVFG